jgi:hypothetical protein
MSGALSSDLPVGPKQGYLRYQQIRKESNYEYPRIYSRIFHWRKQHLSAGGQTRLRRADCESTGELYWLCSLLQSGLPRLPTKPSGSLFLALLFQMLPRNQRLNEAVN